MSIFFDCAGFGDEEIKPIDEHEWSDDIVNEAHTWDGELHFEIDTWSVSMNVEDAKAIAGAFGYKMVKI